jgi:hypothetical protein
MVNQTPVAEAVRNIVTPSTDADIVVFRNKVVEAIEVGRTVYGLWRENAEFAVNKWGSDWLRLKDRAYMSLLGAVDKANAKERFKTLRNIVTSEAEARGAKNPRKTWADFMEYAKETAGLSTAKKSKGGTTHYDKVCEALRTLRNHLPECEPNVFAEFETAWMEIEEIAVRLDMLKETE